MSAVTSKVRIYDLAKELKLETKRLIEEIRREGVDVSVPSNSVSKELAEKIRNRYFPKTAPPKARAIRVIKHAPAPAAAPTEEAEASADVHASASPEAASAQTTRPPVEAYAPDAAGEDATPSAARPSVARLVKKLPPAQRAEPPSAASQTQAEIAEPPAAQYEETGAVEADLQSSATAPTEESSADNGAEQTSPEVSAARQVRVLRPTQAALNAGIKHGERAPVPVVVPAPAAPTPRERAARGGRRGGRDAAFEPHGTPGETASPQTVYTPPADARRPGGRSRRGGRPISEGSRGRGGRFDRDAVVPGRALSLEDRIKGSMGGAGVAVDELKPVRLVEGSTVKEFAEKLGIKPKEVVALLLQRKVFATINQALDNEVASELGKRFGYDVTFVPFEEMVAEEEFEELIAADADDVELPRAPVVTVMGHVDHGKTSLLDAIRTTEVAAGEAINKIDKPEANPARVRQELAGQGLNPVEWGGETEMVEVSAKQRKNLDTLLETVLLTTDILNLKASPTRLASGVVLEAKLDRGRGAVATVLVQQGTLSVHDPFIAGQVYGKVRAMFDDRGQAVTEVGPSTPVEVLGLQGVPQAGDTFQVVADISRAQSISEHRQVLSRQSTLMQSTKRGIETLGQKEIKELLVVLKADVQGSVEVLKSTLTKLSNEQVKVKVIRSGVGAITESDVLLASATQAGASNSAVVVIGFNVRPESRANDLAKFEHVDIRLHSIIYKVEEEIRAAMIGMLDKIETERILGRADVRAVFKVPRAGNVAGCMVTNGVIRRTARARLIRDGVVAWEGGIGSLRRVKDDVSEVREGFECGIGLENFNDVKVGDQIECYIVEQIAATELASTPVSRES
ncbi:MAG: translation initiation factor IF-2 [Acidobacteria bacterium]|nr:translation initiation factor IF-2 [Acidobacteriota bacterium]